MLLSAAPVAIEAVFEAFLWLPWPLLRYCCYAAIICYWLICALKLVWVTPVDADDISFCCLILPDFIGYTACPASFPWFAEFGAVEFIVVL